LYGKETWSAILREGYKMRVFENRVMRRKFVSKREKITALRKILHNEELYNLCFSPNIIRMIKSVKS
jgi:hypothetical protein